MCCHLKRIMHTYGRPLVPLWKERKYCLCSIYVSAATGLSGGRHIICIHISLMWRPYALLMLMCRTNISAFHTAHQFHFHNAPAILVRRTNIIRVLWNWYWCGAWICYHSCNAFNAFVRCEYIHTAHDAHILWNTWHGIQPSHNVY